MSTAAVIRIVRVTKHDEAHTEIDIVHLSYNSKLYIWESPPDAYATGQQVGVNPPVSPGANITPRSTP